jgi:methylphosphotriester-DNA--protein-cysteine methyltransferase
MTYTYVQHIPPTPLNAFIDDLYYWDGPPPHRYMKVLPVPGHQVMINLGDPFQVFEADNAAPIAICTDSWTLGLWDRYHVVQWPHKVRFFGIHFKPGGIYPFLSAPLSDLLNQVVPLEALWGGFAHELRERLSEETDFRAAFGLLEQCLRARLRGSTHGLDIVQYAISEINRQQGSISIRALSDVMGISQNQLGVLFKRMVGIPPKTLARLYRFAHVHLSIDLTRNVNWTYVAHQAGYFDQSHFNKDFAAFSGDTPSDYLRLRRQLEVKDAEQWHITID